MAILCLEQIKPDSGDHRENSVNLKPQVSTWIRNPSQDALSAGSNDLKS